MKTFSATLLVLAVWFCLSSFSVGAERVDLAAYGESVDGDFVAVHGIRFATADRWEPPVDVIDFSQDQHLGKNGTLKRACPQQIGLFLPPGVGTSEDCLLLDVFVPRDAPPSETLPVLVYIHGGGFEIGSLNDAYIWGGMASKVNAVLVVIQYRLGAFGFLHHPSFPAGHANFGLLDQESALRWVHRNIDQFGGDVDNVSLIGESAGGISILFQMQLAATRRSEGHVGPSLFQKGIVMSGPPMDLSPLPIAHQSTRALESGLGCSRGGDENTNALTDAGLQCMREASVDDVLAASPTGMGMRKLFWHAVSDGSGPSPFWPVLDGHVLREQPSDALREGNFGSLDSIIIGNTENEGLLFTWFLWPFVSPPSTSEFYESVMRAGFPHPEVESHLLEHLIGTHYPFSQCGGDVKSLFSRITGDLAFVCPTRWTANTLATHVDSATENDSDDNDNDNDNDNNDEKVGRIGSVYRYSFDYDSPNDAFEGVAHAGELAYFFGKGAGEISFLSPAVFNEEEQLISDAVASALSSFIRTGVPLHPNGRDSWPMMSEVADDSSEEWVVSIHGSGVACQIEGGEGGECRFPTISQPRANVCEWLENNLFRHESGSMRKYTTRHHELEATEPLHILYGNTVPMEMFKLAQGTVGLKPFAAIVGVLVLVILFCLCRLVWSCCCVGGGSGKKRKNE
eukprot:TRINITY_DN1313_c0_g1_i2.p1 TRINITY_DN1313_c0_g1~~TRINITY_DN1313_c0_g1_i2.p1  ORF type:complete len:683 (-),score=126.88 TRINITY_DN1313_c0_g1_i2:39-2087(-)